jgi:hypothetical protein
MAQARGYYERALALDPGNIEALVGTAFVDLISCSIFLTDDRAARAAAAEAALTKVLSVAPNHAWAQCLLGSAFIVFSVRGARGQGPILSYQGKQIVADRRHEGLRWALKQGTASAARLPRSSSGSLAKFAAIRRASSLVSSFAAERRPGSSSK